MTIPGTTLAGSDEAPRRWDARCVTARIALPVLFAVLVAGCGSETVHQLPPAAEPPRSPPLTAEPAGRVTPVGNQPEGVVADPLSLRVAVALRSPARLALVDERTGRVLERVPLPGAARHLALAAPGGPVLVPVEGADRLVAVSPRSGRVVGDSPVGKAPHDAAAAASAWFVGDEGGNRVSVLRQGSPGDSFAVATQPGGVVGIGSDVAVVSVRERRLELYDAHTLRRIGSAPAGVGPTHVACVSPTGPCYVLDTRGGAILVYSLSGHHLEPTRRLYLPGGPYGVAIDTTRHRLWVTLPALNELVELPAHGRPHVLRRFQTVRQPDSVAVDERTGRVFVTGRADGVLETIEPG
jgi:DNA-binding beta-propeller fold protein YncE